jgi:hypothetical protein
MPGSPLLSQRVLRNVSVEREIRDKLLQPPVLLIEFAQALRLAHVEAAVLRAPVVDRLRADAALASEVVDLRAAFGLLEDLGCRGLGESTLAHGALREGSTPRTKVRVDRLSGAASARLSLFKTIFASGPIDLPTSKLSSQSFTFISIYV